MLPQQSANKKKIGMSTFDCFCPVLKKKRMNDKEDNKLETHLFNTNFQIAKLVPHDFNLKLKCSDESGIHASMKGIIVSVMDLYTEFPQTPAHTPAGPSGS